MTKGGRRMNDRWFEPEASVPDRSRIVALVALMLVALAAVLMLVALVAGRSRVRSPARELRKARSLWLKRARPYSSGTGGGGFGNAFMRSWPSSAGGRRAWDGEDDAGAGAMREDGCARRGCACEWEWEWCAWWEWCWRVVAEDVEG